MRRSRRLRGPLPACGLSVATRGGRPRPPRWSWASAVAAWMRMGSELQTLATAVGQQRSVTLADGSVVSLNTNTIVETHLQRSIREIYLRQGEAHFQVAHDRSRPFLVHAGRCRGAGGGHPIRSPLAQRPTRGCGRQRGAASRSGRRVAAEPASSGHGRARVTPRSHVHTLGAGQQLSATGNDYSVVPVSTHRLSSVLAWRDGRRRLRRRDPVRCDRRNRPLQPTRASS